jgi:hypothetical protein
LNISVSNGYFERQDGRAATDRSHERSHGNDGPAERDGVAVRGLTSSIVIGIDLY